MDVPYKGDAEFSDCALEIVRRLCSESLGAEVAKANFRVAGHSVVCPTEISEGNTAKCVRRKACVPIARGSAGIKANATFRN